MKSLDDVKKAVQNYYAAETAFEEARLAASDLAQEMGLCYERDHDITALTGALVVHELTSEWPLKGKYSNGLSVLEGEAL